MGQEAPLFVFSGGGTGGHLYPALAVAEELRTRLGRMRLTFFTSRRKIDEKILRTHEAEVQPQDLAPLSKWPWRWPAILYRLRRERKRLVQYLQVHRPLVVVGTGGLTSVPAILAARKLHIPTVIFNPDAVPGRANRFLAKYVDVVVAQWKDSLGYFPRGVNVEVHGCAIRSGFCQSDRETAAREFGLDPEKKTLVVTGASQGARTINEAVIANLDLFAGAAGESWQILHLTGEADFDMVRAGYAEHRVPNVVLAYTNAMPAALTLADLIVSRAGASTLAEITAVGRASILMPYPFHRDMHQKSNAMCLVRHGAAVIVDDQKDVGLNAPALRSALARLLANDDERLAMSKSAASIGCPHAARDIAERLIALGGGGNSASWSNESDASRELPAVRTCEANVT